MENEADVAAFKNFVDTGVHTSTQKAAAPPPPTPPPVPAPSAPVSAAPAASASSLPSTPPPSGGSRIYATPLARRLAAEKGLSLKVICLN